MWNILMRHKIFLVLQNKGLVSYTLWGARHFCQILCTAVVSQVSQFWRCDWTGLAASLSSSSQQHPVSKQLFSCYSRRGLRAAAGRARASTRTSYLSLFDSALLLPEWRKVDKFKIFWKLFLKLYIFSL